VCDSVYKKNWKPLVSSVFIQTCVSHRPVLLS